MSEPIVERLSRFTPDAGRLDRDSLLYEAGRKSARPNRAWTVSTSLLAFTQVVSLVVLWPGMLPPTGERTFSVNGPPSRAVDPGATLEQLPSDVKDSHSLWAARRRFPESELDDQPASADAGPFVESEPPLRAFTPPAVSLLN
jgi:hypothetical protein